MNNKHGLFLDFDITHLRGATYNPRTISDDSLSLLRESIKRLGLVKPLIVRNNLLVAGHQRTKALIALGIKTAPVFLLSNDTTLYDEVRFNQLHNGTDLDCGDENLRISGGLALGYQVVDPSRISGNFRGKLAIVRKEIATMIIKYGAWGGVVATERGEVIHAAQYALAAKLTNTPLTTYVVPSHRKDEYIAFLNKEYGKFSYEHLPKETYIQTFAQKFRLREAATSQNPGMQGFSKLYERAVIPWLNSHSDARVLDFGSGQGDYAKSLRAQGFNVSEVEFFRRKGDGINLSEVNRMIDYMLKSLQSNGRFDAVVCDSVLNSVDCPKAEKSVMALLNLFCRKGGFVFFSGRTAIGLKRELSSTICQDRRRRVEFLDDAGYTALYRRGSWFYQKFHTEDQIRGLADSHQLELLKLSGSKEKSWQATAKVTEHIPLVKAIEAIEYEFNLPVSKSRRLNRHQDVIKVIGELYERDMELANG